MIRKLLYRFRRLVLVWRLGRISRNRIIADIRYQENYLSLLRKRGSIKLQLAKLDATEMSKGEAHVVVR